MSAQINKMFTLILHLHKDKKLNNHYFSEVQFKFTNKFAMNKLLHSFSCMWINNIANKLRF